MGGQVASGDGVQSESASSYGRRPDGKDTVRLGLVNSACIATNFRNSSSCFMLTLRFTDTVGVQSVLPSDWKQSLVTSRFRFNG